MDIINPNEQISVTKVMVLLCSKPEKKMHFEQIKKLKESILLVGAYKKFHFLLVL